MVLKNIFIFQAMSLLKTISAILVTSIFMYGQCMTQNPFEIKSRLQVDSSTTVRIENNSISQNPFDIDVSKNKSKKDVLPDKKIKRNVNGNSIVYSSYLVKIGVILLFALLFVAGRHSDLKTFNELRQIPSISSNWNKMLQNIGLSVQLNFIILFLSFVLNLAYFVFLTLSHKEIIVPFNPWQIYGILVLIILVIYLLKYFGLRLIEYGFEIKKAVGKYIDTIILHNIFLGIILFGINFFYGFVDGLLSNIFMILGIICISGVYIIRQFRSLNFATSTKRFSSLHFFLYLCAFELAPLVVLLKFLM